MIEFLFVPKSPIENKPELVQVMAWRRTGDKPLPEPLLGGRRNSSALAEWSCVFLALTHRFGVYLICVYILYTFYVGGTYINNNSYYYYYYIMEMCANEILSHLFSLHDVKIWKMWVWQDIYQECVYKWKLVWTAVVFKWKHLRVIFHKKTEQ